MTLQRRRLVKNPATHSTLVPLLLPPMHRLHVAIIIRPLREPHINALRTCVRLFAGMRPHVNGQRRCVRKRFTAHPTRMRFQPVVCETMILQIDVTFELFATHQAAELIASDVFALMFGQRGGVGVLAATQLAT